VSHVDVRFELGRKSPLIVFVDPDLAATLFTTDEKKGNRVAGALVAGTVWVLLPCSGAPFGGSRYSGVGREGGHWSFCFYCDVMNVVNREGTFRPSV
jgi:acyl-CoA reductase-like NAD-dependent aldehyde dehydrogenase